MLSISVCIITKNEADHLEKCLKALQPCGFEIIVVDTGSTDHSKEIAFQYTDKVYDFEWIDDFSAAKNYAVSKASHDLIFSLDTDEFLKEIDLERMEELIQANPKSVGLIQRLDYYEMDGMLECQTVRIERLFDRRCYRFQSPIHETLVSIGEHPYASYDAPVVIDHVGYLGTKEKTHKKAMRDLSLLLPEIEKYPDNPYLYFQVGQCYIVMEDYDKALEYFRMALARDPSPEDDYARILVCNYGNTLLDQSKYHEMLPLLSFYDHYCDNADYLCMIGLMYLHLNQQLKALPEFVKALTASSRDSLNPNAPSYYIGFVYELFGKKEIAMQHYKNCGDYAPAVDALKRIL